MLPENAAAKVCEEGNICDEDTNVDTAVFSCEALGRECGRVSGIDCGNCDMGERCVSGWCACVPDCPADVCGGDGCGGLCECESNKTCNRDGECVEPSACEDDCEILEAECGEICGESCGVCEEGTVCGNENRCEAEPACEETCEMLAFECEQVCGESCGQCSSDETCSGGVCVCSPVCDGHSCDDNGCGGICPCDEGTVCNGEGACLSPESCTKTCDELSFTCGAVCGEQCGICGDNENCINNRCESVTQCEVCPLKLSLLRKTETEGRLTIAVGIDYQPEEDVSRARMLDLLLATDPPMRVVAAASGEALTGVERTLHLNPETGAPWQIVGTGVSRYTVFSTGNSDNFGSGQLLNVVYETTAALAGTAILIYIVKESPVLTPEAAENGLQITPFDMPIEIRIEK